VIKSTAKEVPAPPTKGSPHPIDVHVGALVRARRKQLALSQQNLADAIGLTFQQVQKYERGANRISASKLYEISLFLKMPIEAFFHGLDDDQQGIDFIESSSERGVHAFLRSDEGVEMAATFPKVRIPALRRRIVELVRTMSENDL